MFGAWSNLYIWCPDLQMLLTTMPRPPTTMWHHPSTPSSTQSPHIQCSNLWGWQNSQTSWQYSIHHINTLCLANINTINPGPTLTQSTVCHFTLIVHFVVLNQQWLNTPERSVDFNILVWGRERGEIESLATQSSALHPAQHHTHPTSLHTQPRTLQSLQ